MLGCPDCQHIRGIGSSKIVQDKIRLSKSQSAENSHYQNQENAVVRRQHGARSSNTEQKVGWKPPCGATPSLREEFRVDPAFYTSNDAIHWWNTNNTLAVEKMSQSIIELTCVRTTCGGGAAPSFLLGWTRVRSNRSRRKKTRVAHETAVAPHVGLKHFSQA